ncbi:hypothetical protein HK104_003667 [Borealophlyctis nickersoniae]|nr:hypothetical protein HK104_003667 [Borealophlyctis nickersoniae]
MLSNLPPEVLLHLCTHLNIIPFLRLTSTCRTIHSQLHPHVQFLATTSNRWWFWTANRKNVTSAVDTSYSPSDEDLEWSDSSSESDFDDVSDEESDGGWGGSGGWGSGFGGSGWSSESEDEEENPCLFEALYSAEVQEKIDQILSSSTPSPAETILATLFNDKITMGSLCHSYRLRADPVCFFHLVVFKWAKGILCDRDVLGSGHPVWDEAMSAVVPLDKEVCEEDYDSDVQVE